MANEKRLIDANAIIGKARWMEVPDGNGINYDIKAVSVCTIEDAPTVDAVEVVRCKDCKHYFHYGDEVYGCRTYGMLKTNPDSFCSYGERKDND